MRVWMALLLLIPLCVDAQQTNKGVGKKKGAEPNPEAQVLLDLPPATIAGEVPGEAVSDPAKQSDWPAIAYSGDGSLFAIYVEWHDKDADRVLVRRRDPKGVWQQPVAIADGNWDHYTPAIVGRPKGALAFWSGQSDGNYDLYAAEISPSGQPSNPERVTRAGQ